jgi:hypothetical protein
VHTKIPLLPPEEALKRFADFHIADAVRDEQLARSMSKLNVLRALLNNPAVNRGAKLTGGRVDGQQDAQPSNA